MTCPMKEPFDDIEVLTKEAGLSKVTPNFLIQVMNGVREEKLKAKVVQPYEPLLSVKAWIAIGIVFFLAILFIVLTQVTANETTISSLSMTIINRIKFSVSLPDFVPYQTTVYSICFLVLYFFVQLPMLKHRLNKQFTI